LPEEQIDIGKQIQMMSKKFSEFRETFSSDFSDMEINFKEWNFAVGKTGPEHNIDITAKIILKKKGAPSKKEGQQAIKATTTSEGKFKCPICGQIFGTEKALEEHNHLIHQT